MAKIIQFSDYVAKIKQEKQQLFDENDIFIKSYIKALKEWYKEGAINE